MECHHSEDGYVYNTFNKSLSIHYNTLALAVFTRSPAAYEALKSFKLLQLPSIRSLKSYISSNLEEAGECLKRLQEERKCYQVMVAEQLANPNGIDSYTF